MALRLSARVKIRNPFSLRRLGALGRLHRAAFRPRRRISKRFIGKPAKFLYRLARNRLGLGGTGLFRLDLEDGGHEFTFDVRNTQFGAFYLPQFAGGYEPESTALLDLVIGAKDVFFDIGANWGFYALHVLSRPGFEGRVHAFEPVPDTYRDLESIAAQSPFGARLTCHEVGLSDAGAAAKMRYDDGIQSGLARLDSEAGDIEVVLRRLDDMGLAPPDVIKIDVEGHEAAAFRGGAGVIAAAKPMVLFENWREIKTPAVTMEPFTVLESLGYRFFQPAWIDGRGGRNFATADPPAAEDDGTRVLGLVAFEPEQRFLLAEQINVFACHRDRLDGLAELFQSA